MSFHDQLRQQYRQFKQVQHSLVAQLHQELHSLECYLRQALALDKCYKKAITDIEPTEPYLKIANLSVLEHNADYPSVRFELVVVLDEAEDVYPKTEFKQLFELSYIQSDRMAIGFLPPTKANFLFNLSDDEDNKFRHFAESYQHFVLHQLSKEFGFKG